MARYSPYLDAAMGALSNSLEIQTSHNSNIQAARKIGNIVALSLTLASIQRRVYGETPTTT
jgi:ribosomal protein L18